jgi:hypothetical protein
MQQRQRCVQEASAVLLLETAAVTLSSCPCWLREMRSWQLWKQSWQLRALRLQEMQVRL